MLKFHPLSQVHPSHCFYASLCGLIAGVIFALATHLPLFSNPVWLIIAGLVLLCTFFCARRCLLPLAFCAGFIFASFRVAPELISQQFLDTLVGQTVTISGRISEDPDFSDSSSITLRLSSLQLVSDSSSVPLSGIFYIKLARSTTSDLERSDQLTLTGKLQFGFGTFVGSFFRPTLDRIIRPDPGDIFARFKNFFANLVKSQISSPAADLGLGYLMGQKTGLSADFSEALRTVGMTHVVVASGTHLAIIADLIKKLFGKISKFAGLLFGILAILAFALVVGFTPSMTRAALVALLSLTTSYVGRRFTPGRLIIFTAALTLLLVPTNFLNLGWQLSFGSFIGLLILSPRLTKLLYGGKKPTWLASMLLTSLSTTLICAPIMLYNFGSLSLLSFVANLIILPTLPYAMLLTLLTGATTFLPFLAAFFAHLATLLLNFHIWIVNFLSDKTMFVLTLPPSNPLVFLIYLPILAYILYNIYHEHRHHRPHQRRTSPIRSAIRPEPP